MQRTPVNPWPWSLPLGYNQAEVTIGTARHLTIAGQTAVNAGGEPQHPNDMRGQLALALDNLEAILFAAGMGFSNLTSLRVYSTDVDATLGNFDLLGARLGPAKASPPMTLIGVTRLALPPLLIEIEAAAAD